LLGGGVSDIVVVLLTWPEPNYDSDPDFGGTVRIILNYPQVIPAPSTSKH
jgi:hypothetical protein